MRRCLHAFLVGVLTLSMSMNTARACWYLRHGCHVRHHVVVVCPPAIETIPAGVAGSAFPCCGECGDPVVDWVVDGRLVAGGDWQVAEDVVVGESFKDAASSCDCGGGVVALESETVVADHEGVSSVVGLAVEHLAGSEHPVTVGHEGTESIAAPQPPRAEPVAENPAPASAPIPDLKPTEDVRQAVALGEPEAQSNVVLPTEPPMEEPAPSPKPQQEAPPTVVEPNIFEEVDQAAHEPAAGDGTVGEASAPEETSSSEPVSGEPVPEDEPAADPPGETPADSPAPTEPSAADPLAAVRGTAREPARRWIDRSGDYALVGTLRAVRRDGTCVLEAAGRTIEVPLEVLSDFDRTYATAAAERLAAAAEPESGATAGL